MMKMFLITSVTILAIIIIYTGFLILAYRRGKKRSSDNR